MRADKAKLEAELRVAQFRLQRYEALEAETQRLRALRDSTAGVTDRFVIGDVMDVDLDAFRERVLVDKGASDGVYVGQAVLDSGGVFGQVARVGQLTSEVILVSDAAHAIPVQINRNGLRTIAVGTGDMGRLKLPYLPTSADVIAGDLLVTSGLGGGFPAGYPVGTVAEVKRDPAQSLADVDVKPAAALDRSRELMFVWLKPQAAEVLPQPAAPKPSAPETTRAASRQQPSHDARRPNPPIAHGAVGAGRTGPGGVAAALRAGTAAPGFSGAGGVLLVHRIAARRRTGARFRVRVSRSIVIHGVVLGQHALALTLDGRVGHAPAPAHPGVLDAVAMPDHFRCC